MAAKFYDVQILWKDGTKTLGRGLGNNATWVCGCGELMLGTYQYPIPACPKCGSVFNAVHGEKPRFIDRIEQR